MAKKKNTLKLPKRIAGYKIPKRVRRAAKPLLELAESPQVMALVGAAIAAGTAAMSEGDPATTSTKARKKAMRRLRFLGAEGKDGAYDLADSIGRAIGRAIGSHLPGHAAKPEAAPTAH